MENLPDLWTTVAIVLAFVGFGAAVIAVPKAARIECWIARICFVVAYLILEVKLVNWATDDMGYMRLFFAAILGAVLSVALAYALHWVKVKEIILLKETNTAEVSAPKDVGVLEAKVVFSTSSPSQGNKLEIGNSGTILNYIGPNGKPLFNFFGTNIVVETINGQVLVSTELKDKNGHLTATLYRNEWKVAPPPKIWDRNYSKDALEVIGPDGKVVLQVRALTDRIQLQGEWWGDSINGLRLVKSDDPAQPGAMMILFGKNRLITALNNTEIVKRFVYPSDLHLGELR